MTRNKSTIDSRYSNHAHEVERDTVLLSMSEIEAVVHLPLYIGIVRPGWRTSQRPAGLTDEAGTARASDDRLTVHTSVRSQRTKKRVSMKKTIIQPFPSDIEPPLILLPCPVRVPCVLKCKIGEVI